MADAQQTTKSRALRTPAPRKTTKLKTPPPVPAYASKYAVGDQISHPMYGHGTVTVVDENKLTIDFPENVTRQIIDGYVTHRIA